MKLAIILRKKSESLLEIAHRLLFLRRDSLFLLEFLPISQRKIKRGQVYFHSDSRFGFTLIEMLIVITVVGILSSVALSSLNPARNKARDTRIIEEVNQVRTYAETLYDGDYDALESLPANLIKSEVLRTLSLDIQSQGGELTLRKIGRPATRYIIYSLLNETANASNGEKTPKYYCVDSGGHAVVTSASLDTKVSCPLSN